jgi:hypothetical protein
VGDNAAAEQGTAAILAQHRVAGLVHVTVTTEGPEHGKRRYGTHPATTGRSERVRVRAVCEEATLAHTVRRLGWRGYATNHLAEELSLAQGVAASRNKSLVAHGVGRLPGRSLALRPLCLHDAHRGVALLCLLSIARCVLVLTPCVVRRNLQQAGATLKGLSPGQPGRQTAQPTTEMRLLALRGVTLSCLKIDGKLL